MTAEIQIVWFKRDLRVADHAALAGAAEHGRVLPLYMFEPPLWAQPTMAGRQWSFACESLEELAVQLDGLGAPLLRASGDAVAILEALRAHYRSVVLWSHAETGDAWTYARDRRVAAWARARGVVWHQLPFAGVVRRLRSRDGWAAHWDRVMAAPVLRPPALVAAPSPPALDFDPRLPADPCPQRQKGGRTQALALIESFLTRRGRDYRRAMSSPVTAYDACSRLSPHLAFGTLSTREAAQRARRARAEVKARSGRDGWVGSIDSFLSRLHWRCHFMQKLEDEPALETICLHRACEGLREADHDPERLAAWVAGETGWPLVDASIRALRATGYLNFRMRAMVASVAAYPLWLDWRAYGPPLGAMFTDYEAGIHWSQLQMQAGTTGINATRVYNPIKQQLDQDPEGVFVRRWVPELGRVPLPMLHRPWEMEPGVQEAAGCRIGRDYPAPLVDYAAAAREAKARVHGVRAGKDFEAEKAAIVVRHASRKQPNDRVPRVARPDPQLSFEF